MPLCLLWSVFRPSLRRLLQTRFRFRQSESRAGAGCDGQVLVNQDMLGMFHDFTPKFVKQFANVGEIMMQAFKDYSAEVKAGTFPAQEHTYAISDEVIDKLY